jgi:hypothetical protein
MTTANRSSSTATRKSFLLKAAAYAAFLVLLWHLLEAGFGVFRSGWDQLVERPSVAERPTLGTTGCYLGIYRPEAPHDMDRVQRVGAALGKHLSVVSIYQAWGSAAEHRFPGRELTLIANAGHIPMLTWEPWTTEFDEASFGPRDQRAFRTMRDVGRGVYDSYVREWARECMRWGRPILLRFGHEMNNPFYPWSFTTGNTPDDFKAAWRRVWRIFRDSGCRNVAWVWTPLASPRFEVYYPGEEFVDWVGVTVLNYGPKWPPHRWQPFDELLASPYRRLAPMGKPILIPELGSVGTAHEKAEWHARALVSLQATYPLVRLAIFFDAPNDTSHFKEGIPWSFSGRSSVLSRLRRGVNSNWYRSSLSDRAE